MAEVKAFDKADYGLYPVRCEQWGFLIFVCLDDEAPALHEELGDLPERLAGFRPDEWRLERRLDYRIDANWKLIAENFMEYYHLPWVHPSLVKVSPMDAHYRWQGTGKYVGFCTTPIASNTDSGGWLGLPAIDGPLGGGRGQRALRLALPEHRAQRAAESRLPAAAAPRRAGPHGRDRLPPHASRSRAVRRPSGHRRARRVLGRGQSRGHRDRRARPGRARRTPSTRAVACATASRSRCTASRTWRSTGSSASGASPRGTRSRASRCSRPTDRR